MKPPLTPLVCRGCSSGYLALSEPPLLIQPSPLAIPLQPHRRGRGIGSAPSSGARACLSEGGATLSSMSTQVHDDWGRRFAGGATAITLQLDEASPHGRLEVGLVRAATGLGM